MIDPELSRKTYSQYKKQKHFITFYKIYNVSCHDFCKEMLKKLLFLFNRASLSEKQNSTNY